MSAAAVSHPRGPSRIFFVAGEASGDALAARLAAAIRAANPGVEMAGVGGVKMRSAGVATLIDIAELSVMGISEVVGALRRVVGVYRRVVSELRSERRPNLLVLVDFPDFNLRLARAARRHGVKVVYYVSPQVWAWRQGRVRTIRKCIDAMIVLFPFEEEFYRQHGVPAHFFGHTLAEEVRPSRNRDATRARYDVGHGATLVALLPGSRGAEIRRHLPLMLAACGALTGPVRLVAARAPGIAREMLAGPIAASGLDVAIAEDDTYDLLAAADVAAVASGTATVEAALLGCPSVVVYKMSALTHTVARALVRTPYIAMPNIIVGEAVFPELIQRRATPASLARELSKFIDDPESRSRVRARLALVREALVKPGAAERAAAFVLETLS